MKKINLHDIESHRLAKNFRVLLQRVEQLGTGDKFTKVTIDITSLMHELEDEITSSQNAKAVLDEIAYLATIETDTGPRFNRSFLDDDKSYDRFMTLVNRVW